MAKRVTQRNLDLNGIYEFISARYESLLDGGGTTCDNCNKLISNIVTIKNDKGEHFNVGSDCATTLQSLQSDFNYFSNKDSFAEGKQMRAKIMNHIKKQDGSRWDVILFRIYTSPKEDKKYLVCETRDGGSLMKQIYFYDITIKYIQDLLTTKP